MAGAVPATGRSYSRRPAGKRPVKLPAPAFSDGFFNRPMLVGPTSMSGPDDSLLDPDAFGGVMVANPSEGVYVFYTGAEDEYIRSDLVVDVTKYW